MNLSASTAYASLPGPSRSRTSGTAGSGSALTASTTRMLPDVELRPSRWGPSSDGGGLQFSQLAKALKVEKATLQDAFMQALQEMMALGSTGSTSQGMLDRVAQKVGVRTSDLANAIGTAGPQLVDRRA